MKKSSSSGCAPSTFAWKPLPTTLAIQDAPSPPRSVRSPLTRPYPAAIATSLNMSPNSTASSAVATCISQPLALTGRWRFLS